jgi:hypothetical protein
VEIRQHLIDRWHQIIEFENLWHSALLLPSSNAGASITNQSVFISTESLISFLTQFQSPIVWVNKQIKSNLSCWVLGGIYLLVVYQINFAWNTLTAKCYLKVSLGIQSKKLTAFRFPWVNVPWGAGLSVGLSTICALTESQGWRLHPHQQLYNLRSVLGPTSKESVLESTQMHEQPRPKTAAQLWIWCTSLLGAVSSNLGDNVFPFST